MIYTRIKNTEGETLYEFFKRCFDIHDGKFCETFHDPELTQEECHKARRSFKALVEIAQTYYPNTSEKEVAALLVKAGKDQSFRMSTLYCPDIKKWVFNIYPNFETYEHILRSTQEPLSLHVAPLYRLQYDSTSSVSKRFEYQGTDGYSLQQIMDLAKEYEAEIHMGHRDAETAVLGDVLQQDNKSMGEVRDVEVPERFVSISQIL
jgi:hypothetical protein